jgi:hypothetical protein
VNCAGTCASRIGFGWNRYQGTVGPGRASGTIDPAWRSVGRSIERPDPSQPSWPRMGRCASWSKPNSGNG